MFYLNQTKISSEDFFKHIFVTYIQEILRQTMENDFNFILQGKKRSFTPTHSYTHPCPR